MLEGFVGVLMFSELSKTESPGIFVVFEPPGGLELQLLWHSKARRHQFQGRTGSLCVNKYSTEILHQCVCVCVCGWVCVCVNQQGSTRGTKVSQWSTRDLGKQSFTACVCLCVYVRSSVSSNLHVLAVYCCNVWVCVCVRQRERESWWCVCD